MGCNVQCNIFKLYVQFKIIRLSSPAWKVSTVFIPNTGKYGPEKTPYLDTFHAVLPPKIAKSKNIPFVITYYENAEVVVLRFFTKKVFLEIQQNSQENTCASDFIKKGSLAQVFSCECSKILKTHFLTEHFRWLLLKIK